MTYRQTAAKVAEAKRKHPERYCPEQGCLWRTGGEYCPRHRRSERQQEYRLQELAFERYREDQLGGCE